MLPDKLSFVDIETTGTSARFGRVIEIGILRVENGKVSEEYNTLINPHTYLPPEITMLTGITSEQLQEAPSFDEISSRIYELIDDSVFVAHNVRFDYSFLKNEFARLETPFSPKHFCTVRLSRMLFPKHRHHNLDSIIERFSIPCPSRHRAFDDAKVLYDFYNILQKTVDEKLLIDAVNRAMKKPSIPVKLKNGMLEKLPESPGVYIFYGTVPTDLQQRKQEKNKTDIVPLYIGKSVNIRERVMSHFSSDIRSGTEMKISQQIESIEALPTAGELGALFLESQLIKEKLPMYNKMLRRKQGLVSLKKVVNNDGYFTVQMDAIDVIDVNDLDAFIGFFRSRRQAKDYLHRVKEEHELCECLLGLEKTKGACFGYRLGKCHGACVKEEMNLKYNMRFIEAFSDHKILPWPFNGAILIEENNPLDGRTDFFVIDKWCYLGTIKADKLGSHDEKIEKEYHFDLDTYKILSRFMKNVNNLKKIKEIQKPGLVSISEDFQRPL